MHRRHALTRLAAGTAATLALPAWSQNERRLVLGQSAPLSGPAAQLGLQMQRGAQLYFDRVNAQGGVAGRRIELKTLDDGYEPERCVKNTEALIRDGVFALFGYVGTPTALAVQPLVDSARLPFFAPFTGAQGLREPFNRLVFHVRASYFDETALIVRQLHALGLHRLAVFRQNDSYGQAGLDGVLRAMQPLKLQPVAVGLVERNSSDVAAAVRAIVAKQPQAVVQVSAYKSCAAFVRAARQAGYGGTFYNLSFVGTQALARELGREGRGVMVSQVMPFPYNPTAPLAREFAEAEQLAKTPPAPDYTAMEGYVAAKVFTEGLRRAGAIPTRESLMNGLETLQRWDAGGYTVNFGPRNHEASRFVELAMLNGDGTVRR